jgi:hypothetical protein
MTCYKCKECGQEFKKLRGLHGHIKKHGLKIDEYYYKYFPRFDLYTHKPIRFKSRDQYLTADFNSAANFKKWCEKEPPHIVKKYFTGQIKLKIQEKNEKNMMGQVHLKSYKMPDLLFIEDLYGSLNRFYKELNMGPKLHENITENFYKSYENVEIWVDTREQNPLKFKNPTKLIKLDCGDYTVGGENFNHTFVDRKSANDFVSTMTVGFERFKNEIERCKSVGGHLFVVIEASMERVEREMMFLKSRTSASLVWHNMREIIRQYGDHCQFVFSGSRKNSEILIPKILVCGKDLWETDIQLNIERDDRWIK